VEAAARTAGRGPIIQVVAYSTPSSGGWYWRIMDYSGELVEESRERFPTIGEAVALGAKRLGQINLAAAGPVNTGLGRTPPVARS
jgi:hypothetical protein